MSKSCLSKACLMSMGLRLWQQTRIQAPHLMQAYSLTFSAGNCLALGSFGSFFSVRGLSLPIWSSFGTVRFMMTSASMEPPKKFMPV